VVLRRRTPPDEMIVKMWLFPWLSIATIVAILAVLAQMYMQEKVRPQLLQSLLVWAIMLGLYFIIQWRRRTTDVVHTAKVHKVNRVLVLANKTVGAAELLDELQRIDRAGEAKYFVCAPAHFVDTGVTELTGSVWVERTSVEEARNRLEQTLSTLRAHGLSAKGGFGDRLPMRALEYAVAAFTPDQIVISTYPQDSSPWLHHDIVERARHAYPAIPVTHVVAPMPAVLV